jgi:hypothetical protein
MSGSLSAYPGKVGTGFPKEDMRHFNASPSPVPRIYTINRYDASVCADLAAYVVASAFGLTMAK